MRQRPLYTWTVLKIHHPPISDAFVKKVCFQQYTNGSTLTFINKLPVFINNIFCHCYKKHLRKIGGTR